MIYSEKEENKDKLQESIAYLENKGFENIKADLDGYEKPKSYLKKSTNELITPDIVAERAGIKHYIEVGLKSEQKNLLKSKWRFLDVLSSMKEHRFKVITYHGHFRFTNEILKDLNLNKKLIRI
ncbi:hypothetical protein J1N09_08705 [Aureitalea sp. L0-47]|uniref:hypothetical protein n=1 Tax=Aureitalea sp. L0-47 TaxID=2816962 RepID=UPI002237DB8F|nr:hypothetical protein [Aureitalea sp. L0-47]MCW5519915.1 hypothetical protein [Aureitalea sp. L0-47]